VPLSTTRFAAGILHQTRLKEEETFGNFQGAFAIKLA